MVWAAPAGVSGDWNVIRLSASLLDRAGDDHCAEFAALKVRPKVVPDDQERRYVPWEAFPLGVVMNILDAVEFDAVDADKAVAQTISGCRSAVHPGLAVWLRHAVCGYLAVAGRLATALAADGVELLPQSRPRVVQHVAAGSVRMLTAWGRWYVSRDGTVREFRRLRYREPRGAPDGAATLALAYVAAAGTLVAGNPNRDQPVAVLAERGAGPTRVRVVEVGLTEASARVLVDAHPDEILPRYGKQVRPAAARLVEGGRRVPGRDCADCKGKDSCPALPRVPGLLGLDSRGTHRRTWSVSTGRYYKVCPAQTHLRELHLPGDRAASEAVRRGVALHAWLAAAHDRPGGHPCSPTDIPEPGGGDIGIAAQVMTNQEYRGLRPFLAQHLAVCPLMVPGTVTDLAVERSLAAFDTVADVMVIAKPDLLRRVDGRLVYRELKTSATPHAITTSNAMSLVPQLALAVCMIADGVFGDGPRTAAGHVDGQAELELLTPVTANVIAVGTATAGVVTTARQVVTRLASAWHGDIDFAPVPGPWCTACPVARWCPDATEPAAPAVVVVDGVTIDARTGEVISAHSGLTSRAEAVADVIREPIADDEPDT